MTPIQTLTTNAAAIEWRQTYPGALVRAIPADLEIRDGGDGRTICGIACPFDSPTNIRDMSGEYIEVFRQGAFAKTIQEQAAKRVKTFAKHDSRALPLGRADLLREDTQGLYAELRISDTTAGREALELVRDGALDALSIGFRPITHRGDPDSGGVVERTEVALLEISLVDYPAYSDAVITGVRHEDLEADHPEDGPVTSDDEPTTQQAGHSTRQRIRIAHRRAQWKGLT